MTAYSGRNWSSMNPDKLWLHQLNEVVEQHLNKEVLNNERLAQLMSISERHLFRKMKQVCGLSPQRYLLSKRLEQAKSLLEEGRFRTVNEAANAIGFQNVSYFIRIFEEKYGRKPLKVLRDAGWR